MTHEDVELTNTNLNIEVHITDSVEAMKVEIFENEPLNVHKLKDDR